MKVHLWLLLLLIFVLVSIPVLLAAESIVANPSFEIAGSGGNHFGGWNQFGITGTTDMALHGFRAAKVRSQNDGNLNVSGFWQPLEGGPGQRWVLAGYVMNPTVLPLQGNGFALVNLEWRNQSGGLIGYDTFTVATATTPAGQYIPFQHISTPAPAGTAYIHVLAGLLQTSSDPAMDVYYDQLTCFTTTHPTLDETQWMDFPGGRTLEFSDRLWRVKGPGWYGPGPNYFSDSQQSIWVDAQQRLHITQRQVTGGWQSSEIVLDEALGYGDYIFTTLGPLEALDPNTVLGLFLWQYGSSGTAPGSWWNPYNEIDIEYSRWGSPSTEIGQFVAQPWDWTGNMWRYNATFGTGRIASHAFRWLPDRVEFRSWFGGPDEESPANMISSWIYTGPHIPRPEQPRVHINLWYIATPSNSYQEVVLDRFTFHPIGYTGPLQAPRNVLLQRSGNNLLLSWDPDPEVVTWTVWSSDDPYSGFDLRASTQSNSCLLENEVQAYPSHFYRIIANN